VPGYYFPIRGTRVAADIHPAPAAKGWSSCFDRAVPVMGSRPVRIAGPTGEPPYPTCFSLLRIG